MSNINLTKKERNLILFLYESIFFVINSRHVEMLLDEIKRNEIDQAEGTNLQQLMSRFTLNVICGALKKLFES